MSAFTAGASLQSSGGVGLLRSLVSCPFVSHIKVRCHGDVFDWDSMPQTYFFANYIASSQYILMESNINSRVSTSMICGSMTDDCFSVSSSSNMLTDSGL